MIASGLFSPDGHVMASCGLTGQVIHLWDARAGRELRRIETGERAARPARGPGHPNWPATRAAPRARAALSSPGR